MFDHYGVHFGIYLWQNALRAVSFPVTKNHRSWLPFAERNSRSLEAALLEKCREPESFIYPVPGNGSVRRWYFSLAGYIFDEERGTWDKVRGLDRFDLVHSFAPK